MICSRRVSGGGRLKKGPGRAKPAEVANGCRLIRSMYQQALSNHGEGSSKQQEEEEEEEEGEEEKVEVGEGGGLLDLDCGS